MLARVVLVIVKQSDRAILDRPEALFKCGHFVAEGRGRPRVYFWSLWEIALCSASKEAGQIQCEMCGSQSVAAPPAECGELSVSGASDSPARSAGRSIAGAEPFELYGTATISLPMFVSDAPDLGCESIGTRGYT